MTFGNCTWQPVLVRSQPIDNFLEPCSQVIPVNWLASHNIPVDWLASLG